MPWPSATANPNRTLRWATAAILALCLTLTAFAALATPECITPAELEAELEFTPQHDTYSPLPSSALGQQLIYFYLTHSKRKHPHLTLHLISRLKLYLFPDRVLITFLHQGTHLECILGHVAIPRSTLQLIINSLEQEI